MNTDSKDNEDSRSKSQLNADNESEIGAASKHVLDGSADGKANDNETEMNAGSIKDIKAKPDAVNKVKEYKESIIKRAEQFVIESLPEKIIMLSELSATSIFCKRKLSDVIVNDDSSGSGDGPPKKKIRLEPYLISDTKIMTYLTNRLVPCNDAICKMFEIIKPIINELRDDLDLLEMWIRYMIPKIEDGDNSGVIIQHQILEQIQETIRLPDEYSSRICEYFNARAKMVSNVESNPYVEDYRQALIEYDERQYLLLSRRVIEIKNQYSSLYDAIMKNMKKLKKPRNSNAQSYC
uniref:Proteasome activator PA28 C-terminal domain-containing protein n=1 Tax=Glossina brevipalpis TaxID=37001 RepID=A0A1A9WB48_9MUSC